jgi:hypothetical protein
MAAFLLVYSGGDPGATEAEREKSAQAWDDWLGKLGSALIDAGNPTLPVSKHISSDRTVEDGPIGVAATGYSIVQANSLDTATKLARDCPVLDGGGAVTIYETFEIQSMFEFGHTLSLVPHRSATS